MDTDGMSDYLGFVCTDDTSAPLPLWNGQERDAALVHVVGMAMWRILFVLESCFLNDCCVNTVRRQAGSNKTKVR